MLSIFLSSHEGRQSFNPTAGGVRSGNHVRLVTVAVARSHNMKEDSAISTRTCTVDPMQPAVAKSPFNLPNADVRFLTADNVLFHLHKNILSIASPFFNDMFSLTQVSDNAGTSTEEHIPVTESSIIFDALLRLLYPVAKPPLTERVRVEEMLEAALKYQLEEAIMTLRSVWRLFIPKYPLQIFATACRLRLEKEARMAADSFKEKAVWKKENSEYKFKNTIAGASYVKEMAAVPAGTYFRLMYFLGDKKSDLSASFIEPGDPTAHQKHQEVSSTSSCVHESDVDTPFPFPDITLRSRDGLDVPTHRSVVRFASGDKLLGQPSLPSEEESRLNTVYEVDADAVTLRSLLRLCYPFAHVDFNALDEVDAVIQLAQKYEVKLLLNLIKEQYAVSLPNEPLRGYFLASKWGWSDIAHKAAMHLARSHTGDLTIVYCPAMEYVSAPTYYQLLKFIYTCRTAVIQALDACYSLSLWDEFGGAFDIQTLASFAVDLSASRNMHGSYYASGCRDCRVDRGKPDCSCRKSALQTCLDDHRKLQEAIEYKLSQ
jgi:hypothetical protein